MRTYLCSLCGGRGAHAHFLTYRICYSRQSVFLQRPCSELRDGNSDVIKYLAFIQLTVHSTLHHCSYALTLYRNSPSLEILSFFAKQVFLSFLSSLCYFFNWSTSNRVGATRRS